jgi:ABC-type branched-subunit amino acid transport system substrate-binding protein
VVRFVERFRATFGRDPGFIEAIAYDSARILLGAIRQPGVRLRTGIRNALWGLRDFDGVTGTTAFDTSGEALKRPFLLQVRDNGFVELDPRTPPAWTPIRRPIPPPPP